MSEFILKLLNVSVVPALAYWSFSTDSWFVSVVLGFYFFSAFVIALVFFVPKARNELIEKLSKEKGKWYMIILSAIATAAHIFLLTHFAYPITLITYIGLSILLISMRIDAYNLKRAAKAEM